MDDEEKQKGIVDSLYDSLKPFASQNYTYRKYIEKAFRRLQNKINEHITLRVGSEYYIEHSDDHAIEEDEAFLKALDDAIDGTATDPKMLVIAEALRKSAIKGTERIVKAEKGLKSQKKEFSKPDADPEWIDAIYRFDYKKLNQLKEYNAKILSESKPELYLQQAYICSFLGDYLSAYYCLNNAATYFYRKREFAWYFISLWNKRNVGQIISADFFYNAGIDPTILASIKQEYDAIDLDKTLQTIPNLGNDHNQFLRDLKDFKFASDLFYDVFSHSLKASAQAAETYFMFVGLPAYEQIRRQVYDYYNYGIYNCIQVDRYRENNEIYNLFARSILASASAPDKEHIGESVFGDAGNIHAEYLNETDIHLILRYIDSGKLKKLFREFNTNVFEISEDGVEYLKDIASNLPEFFQLKATGGIGRDIFWRFICFASHINIDADLAISICRILTDLKKQEYIDNRRDSVMEFINAIYGKELYNNENLCESAKDLVNRLIELVADNSGLLSIYRNPIISLVSFCKEGGLLFDDENHIKMLLKEGYYQILPSIYTGSSDNVKQIIQGEFEEWSCPDTAEGYITYSELVLAEVIEPDKELESKAFDFVIKHNEEKRKQKENGLKSYSSDDNVENCFLNLYLSDMIIDVDRLKNVISESEDEFSKWLFDAEGYDYTQFNLGWLNHCYPSLLTKLAGNEKIRDYIVTVYKEKYQTEFIDKKTNEILIKYFIK